MTDQPAVELHDVTFTYEGGTVALEDINLTVPRGTFAVVLGANGAGKSTLCYLLSGVVPHIYGGQRTGQVRVGGQDPWDQPLHVTAQRCGVLLQDPEAQLFMPTLRSELAFGPANLGVPRQEILRRVEAVAELVGLAGLEERNPKDLSGGQKQRAALGAVLTMQPEVLVLDEPTSQLDPLGRWEVVQALERLKATQRVTVVMTTHETEEILNLADLVVVLDRGRIVLQGPPDQVFAQTDRLEAVGVKTPALIRFLAVLEERTGCKGLLEGQNLTQIDANRVASQTVRLIREGSLATRPVPPGSDQTTIDRPVVLEARNLTYRYPGYPPVTALRDVNVQVREGEFLGIVGQNGSGKSTLVKHFVGLLRPTEGQVLFRGQPVSRFSVGDMARRVGLVLQNPDYQLFTISAREEIRFGLRNLKLSPQEIEAAVEEALRWVGLEEEAELFPFRLSFGDRRKLAVAATVALDPDVLILDEPTTAQDYRGRYQLAEIARRFHQEKGRTVIMITHDMDLVARYAHRLIVMWEGRILLDGLTAQVFGQTEELARSFLRPPEANHLARLLAPWGIAADILTLDDLLQAVGPENRRDALGKCVAPCLSADTAPPAGEA